MIIRNLDSTGDWLFGHSLSDYLYDEAAIELNVKTKLQEWQGNCYFSMLSGIDWINLLGKGKLNSLLLSLKTLMLSCYGVINVNYISVSNISRNYTITYSIDTVYGLNFQSIITQGL